MKNNYNERYDEIRYEAFVSFLCLLGFSLIFLRPEQFNFLFFEPAKLRFLKIEKKSIPVIENKQKGLGIFPFKRFFFVLVHISR